MARLGIIGTGGLAFDTLAVLDDTISTHHPSLASREWEAVVVHANDGPRPEEIDAITMPLDHWLEVAGPEDYYAIAEDSGITRQATQTLLSKCAAQPLALTNPSTQLRGNCQLAKGAVIGPQSFFCDIGSVGQHFLCGAFAVFGPGTSVGNYVTVNHRVVCEGNIILEDQVTIEQSVVIAAGKPDNPIRIGSGATLRAGAYINGDVAADEVVLTHPEGG
jgi:UDP-3-O-[3-hydroxymyristoyl] glucosamine N-acyltransferase